VDLDYLLSLLICFLLFVRTPAPKRQRLVVESDGEGEEEPTPVRLGKNGERLAPCGASGKLMELGRATGIIAVTLFGYDVSFESAHSADRLRIFKSAAWYALTEAELDEMFQHEEADVESYVRGIVTAGIRLWKYEAAQPLLRRSFICLIVLIILICVIVLIILMPSCQHS
jgi:hypothetical protein